MNIDQLIQDLKAERDRLSQTIHALERLHVENGTRPGPKRRGRKFMGKKDREEVSERMKRYWAERRKLPQENRPVEEAGRTGSGSCGDDAPRSSAQTTFAA